MVTIIRYHFMVENVSDKLKKYCLTIKNGIISSKQKQYNTINKLGEYHVT